MVKKFDYKKGKRERIISESSVGTKSLESEPESSIDEEEVAFKKEK